MHRRHRPTTLDGLERELAATRDELDALRSAFAETRDDMRKEIEAIKATQRVSPLYGDSMEMAIAGASADEISARCGIARAEAELVLALVQARGDGQGGSDLSGGGGSRYGSY